MAEEVTEEASAAPNSSKKIIIIIVLAILLSAGVAGAIVWFLLSDSDEAQESAGTEPAKKEAIYVNIRTPGGRPAFITNFHSEEGKQRFLQAFVVARVRDQSAAEELERHMPLVVHRLNTLFGNQSFVELQTSGGKEALRKKATAEVQQVLLGETGSASIDQIFFTNFVMQ